MAQIVDSVWYKEFFPIGDCFTAVITFDSKFGKVPAGTGISFGGVECYCGPVGYSSGFGSAVYIDACRPDDNVSVEDLSIDDFMAFQVANLQPQVATILPDAANLPPTNLRVASVKQSPVMFHFQVWAGPVLYNGRYVDDGPANIRPADLPINTWYMPGGTLISTPGAQAAEFSQPVGLRASPVAREAMIARGEIDPQTFELIVN